MKLDEFISNTLKSIIKGVNESKEYAKNNGAKINPHIGNWDYDKTYTTYYKNEDGARAISKIDFDVAVITSSSQEIDGEGGINVYTIKLGGKLTDKEKNESVSRIKFSLNVVLPSEH